MPKSLFETDLCLPIKKLPRSLGVQTPPWLAVRLGRIPTDLTFETGQTSDQFDQILDRDLAAGAQIDRGGVVHHFGGPNDALGGIIHVEELPTGGARPPALDVIGTRIPGRDALSDECGNDMRGMQVEIVARTVEVHRKKVGTVQGVLTAVAVEHHHRGLLGDSVRSVRRFRIALPEIFLREGDRRVTGIGTDRARLDELLDAVHTRLFDQVQGHRHVREEVPTGVVEIRTDPPHFGGQVDDDIGTCVDVEPRSTIFGGEVVVTTARYEDITDTPLLKSLEHEMAEKSGTTGHDDSFLIQIQDGPPLQSPYHRRFGPKRKNKEEEGTLSRRCPAEPAGGVIDGRDHRIDHAVEIQFIAHDTVTLDAHRAQRGAIRQRLLEDALERCRTSRLHQPAVAVSNQIELGAVTFGGDDRQAPRHRLLDRKPPHAGKNEEVGRAKRRIECFAVERTMKGDSPGETFLGKHTSRLEPGTVTHDVDRCGEAFAKGGHGIEEKVESLSGIQTTHEEQAGATLEIEWTIRCGVIRSRCDRVVGDRDSIGVDTEFDVLFLRFRAVGDQAIEGVEQSLAHRGAHAAKVRAHHQRSKSPADDRDALGLQPANAALGREQTGVAGHDRDIGSEVLQPLGETGLPDHFERTTEKMTVWNGRVLGHRKLVGDDDAMRVGRDPGEDSETAIETLLESLVDRLAIQRQDEVLNGDSS